MTKARDPYRSAEAVWRLEAPRLIAVGVRLVRDVDLAEDLAQDALVAALEQWPRTGIPDNAAAWMTAVVKRRAIDRIRRNERFAARQRELLVSRADAADASAEPDVERIDDDLLRLIFIACHPAISQQSRVALTLRLLGGLTTAEIARAFLVPHSTIAQRIVRAKHDLARARAALEEPSPRARLDRIPAVLEVIYLIFNEGYTATAGEAWTRVSLCEEALRLARVLRALIPDDTEVLGLLALCELQSSRLAARVDSDGLPILLEHQDRRRWDRARIRRGLDTITAADALDEPVGPYLIQAHIAACHARAASAAETDWATITWWYDLLAELMPSPVVQLNRAVAISLSRGPTPALALLDEIASHRSMTHNHLYHAVRANVLTKLGRVSEADAANQLGAALTSNLAEERLLRDRISVDDPARDASLQPE